MKSFITLATVVIIAIGAFNLAPKIPTKNDLSHIEATQTVDVATSTIEKETAVVEPLKQAEEIKQAPIVSAPAPQPKVAEPPRKVAPGGCELAFKYDWPANTAKAICMAESSGIPTKANMNDNHGKCRGSYGLMQVGCFWFPYYGHSLGKAYDPETNMAVAYQIYKRSGSFGAWTTYTDGSYKKYL